MLLVLLGWEDGTLMLLVLFGLRYQEHYALKASTSPTSVPKPKKLSLHYARFNNTPFSVLHKAGTFHVSVFRSNLGVPGVVR
jgi:hypothetical protein